MHASEACAYALDVSLGKSLCMRLGSEPGGSFALEQLPEAAEPGPLRVCRARSITTPASRRSAPPRSRRRSSPPESALLIWHRGCRR